MTIRRKQRARLANESEGEYHRERALKRKPRQINSQWIRWLILRAMMTRRVAIAMVVLIRWMSITNLSGMPTVEAQRQLQTLMGAQKCSRVLQAYYLPHSSCHQWEWHKTNMIFKWWIHTSMQKHGGFVSKKSVMNILAMIKVSIIHVHQPLYNLWRIQQWGSMNNVVHIVLYSHHMVAVVTAAYQIYLPSYLHLLHLPNHRAVNENLSLRTTRWLPMTSTWGKDSTIGILYKWNVNFLAMISLDCSISCLMTSSTGLWILHAIRNYQMFLHCLSKPIGEVPENMVPQ